MFTTRPIVAKLDEEINAQLEQLDQNRSDPAKYDAIVERIAKLQKMKSEEKLPLPNLDTALIVGANLFGIIWLTAVERETPITSKAIGFIMRTR